MPNIPGSNFVVHAIRKSDGVPVTFPPQANFNAAKHAADEAVEDGIIEPEFYMTFTSPNGETATWYQT